MNYTSVSSKSVSVSVSLMSATLNNNSWSVIKNAASAGIANSYWSVGDCKAITLNDYFGGMSLSNYTTYVYILDFNHTEGSKGNLNGNHIVFGGFKTALKNGVDIALCTNNYSNVGSGLRMNAGGSSSYNYGGWKGCDLRYDRLGATSTPATQYNITKSSSNVGYDATSSTISTPVANTFMSSIPSDLRDVIKLRDHWVDNYGSGYDGKTISSVIDACFLLTEYEMYGSQLSANTYEYYYNTRMAYYVNGNSKVKYKHSDTSTTCYQWLCSPCRTSNNGFCIAAGNSVGQAMSNREWGIAPCFIVG